MVHNFSNKNRNSKINLQPQLIFERFSTFHTNYSLKASSGLYDLPFAIWSRDKSQSEQGIKLEISVMSYTTGNYIQSARSTIFVTNIMLKIPEFKIVLIMLTNNVDI